MLDQPVVVGFSGHETFPFRYAWLKKGVDAVAEDGAVFSSEDALTRLGVGKNMVRSIRHWCLAARVLEEDQDSPSSRSPKLRPSRLGQAIFGKKGWDPYLEDPATLWLIHWQIASNTRRATTWFWAFSHVHEPEFTKDSLLLSLTRWVETAGWKRVSPGSLRRDIDCFVGTYVPSRQVGAEVLEDSLDCPLVELGLIRQAGERYAYQFNRGAQPGLPTGLLHFAVLDYWCRAAHQTTTLSLRELTHSPGSPGRLFQMDEDSLAARLEEVEAWTRKAITYDETAGLRQLYMRERVPHIAMLEKHYGRRIPVSATEAAQ